MSVISAPGRRRAKLSPLLESLLRSGVRVTTYDFGKVHNDDQGVLRRSQGLQLSSAICDLIESVINIGHEKPFVQPVFSLFFCSVLRVLCHFSVESKVD